MSILLPKIKQQQKKKQNDGEISFKTELQNR